jgi:aurora kinase
LNCQGTIKISDFGWSAHSPNDRRTTFCGTLDYLTPEHLNREQYGKAVDIWSIAVLTYEFICGRPPFENQDENKTKKNIQVVQYQFPDFISDEAKDFIDKILKKDP